MDAGQPSKTAEQVTCREADFMPVLSLRLAFAAAAPGVLAGILGDMANITVTRHVQMVFYLPAVLFGIRSWWRHASFARSWPVVTCALVVWIGYLYATPRTLEGLEFIAQVSILLPVAALIVETGAWMLCARTYVYANVLVFAVLLWIEYQKQGTDLFLELHRFGLVLNEEGSIIANPNGVGGQFAFAAVLAFTIYLRAGIRRKRKPAAGRPKGLNLGWSLFYSLLCILTASRSAFTALFAGMGTLLIWGTKTQKRSRVGNLLALSGMAASVVLLLAISDISGPWHTLKMRFQNVDNVASLGGRTGTWQDAYRAWRSDPNYMLIGTGTGSADQVLGQFDDYAYLDEHGVWRRSTHSAYVEWALTFGLLGIIPAVCLLIAMWHKGRKMDLQDGGSARQAILLCICLLGAAAPVYRHPCFLAPGSLILAMLSDPPRIRRNRRLPHWKSLTFPVRLPYRSRGFSSSRSDPSTSGERGVRPESVDCLL